VLCLFAAYGNCRWWTSKTSRCCLLVHRYSFLLRRSMQTNRRCKFSLHALNNKILGLKRTLDSQQVVIRDVPPSSAPLTGEELNIRKDRMIRILQETDFTKIPGKNATTTRPTATTNSPPATTNSSTATTNSSTATTTSPTATTTELSSRERKRRMVQGKISKRIYVLIVFIGSYHQRQIYVKQLDRRAKK